MEDTIKIELLTPLTGTFLPNEMEQDWEGEEYHELEEEQVLFDGEDLIPYVSEIQEKILATMRSRAISCSIIIQNIAQMKALFKDSWESLIGNCDEFLYLGGNEKEGHKYVSELLGKETLDTNTYGQTKGRSGSYSVNFQQSGRDVP